MYTRFLTQADAIAHEKIASHSFCCRTDLPADLTLPSPVMVGCFTDEGELMADLEVLEREAFFYGQKLSCAAIGGVCSMPVYRNRGAVRQLFDFVKKTGKYDISVLYPFSTEFYGKLGYGSCGSSCSAVFPFSCFAHITRSSSVKLYEGKNPKDLIQVYNIFAEKYNFCLERKENSDRFCSRPFAEQRYDYVWYDAEGTPRAECKIVPDRDTKTLHVPEIYFDSPDSLHGMLGFIRCFDGNFDYISFENLPMNSPVIYCASDLARAKMGMQIHVAVSIFDCKKAIETANYTRDGIFTVGIDGEKYKVTVSGGKAECESFDGNPQIQFSRATFSAILSEGVSDRDRLIYLPGFCENNKNTAFYGILKPYPVFICDEF